MTTAPGICFSGKGSAGPKAVRAGVGDRWAASVLCKPISLGSQA